MLTLHLRKPMTLNYAEDDQRKETRCTAFDCPPLADGQAPPDPGLVNNLHRQTSDVHGVAVPIETLQRFDLREGLRRMLIGAWGNA